MQRTHAFAEKVAVVTDAGNAVGRAVALQLALNGCYVVAGFSDSSNETDAALSELKNLGTLAAAVYADTATTEGAARLFGEVEQTFGRLDILVNTARFNPQLNFVDTTEFQFFEIMERNLKSHFFCTQNARKLMLSRPSPVIVNVLDACAESCADENAAFVAAQNAVKGLTKSLAVQFAPQIRVNGVAVDFGTDSNDVQNVEFPWLAPEKGTSSDDAARVVMFLLSSEAKTVRGEIIKIA